MERLWLETYVKQETGGWNDEITKSHTFHIMQIEIPYTYNPRWLKKKIKVIYDFTGKPEVQSIWPLTHPFVNTNGDKMLFFLKTKESNDEHLHQEIYELQKSETPNIAWLVVIVK